MSNQTQALALLDAAAAESPVIPWNLDWFETISRLRILVLKPELLHQRDIQACGPAVFFRLWFGRDPLGAATFGYRLLKSGGADIGPLTITPGVHLLQTNYAALRATANANSKRLPELMKTLKIVLLSAMVLTLAYAATARSVWFSSKDDEDSGELVELTWEDLIPADFKQPENPFDTMPQEEIDKLLDGSDESNARSGQVTGRV